MHWIESADKNLIYFRERAALHISAAFLFKYYSECLLGQKKESVARGQADWLWVGCEEITI